MKKRVLIVLLVAGVAATAQVKVGKNLATISSTANLQVEGDATTNQFVVQKDGRVGIGTNAPANVLSIADDGTVGNGGLSIAASSRPASILLDSRGSSFSGGVISGRVGNGTIEVPTDVLNNDTSLLVSGWGFDNGTMRENTRMEFRNSQDASFSLAGGYLQFYTTPVSNSFIGVQRRMIITQDGNVGLGNLPQNGNIILKSKLTVIGLSEYANNAAAIAAGLTAGAFYRDATGTVKVVF
jgi:hypothetical protein